MYLYKIEVLKVIDGDTIDVRIDLGFNVWHKCRVRFMGINTPESRTKNLEEKAKGLAAKKRLKELLSVDKADIKMQSYGVGKYGRVLGEVFVDDKNINQQLVKEGHAVFYDGGKR